MYLIGSRPPKYGALFSTFCFKLAGCRTTFLYAPPYESVLFHMPQARE